MIEFSNSGHWVKRSGSPPISLYFMSDDSPILFSVNCLFCKRKLMDAKGAIDMVVGTPEPTNQAGVVIQIRCKQCRQDYRLLIS